MTESLIKNLSLAVILLSFAVSLYCGLRRYATGWGLLWGWSLFVVALLCQDIISPLIAYHYLGHEAANRLSPDQPGTAGAIFVGWMPALLFYFFGKTISLLLLLYRKRRAHNDVYRRGRLHLLERAGEATPKRECP